MFTEIVYCAKEPEWQPVYMLRGRTSVTVYRISTIEYIGIIHAVLRITRPITLVAGVATLLVSKVLFSGIMPNHSWIDHSLFGVQETAFEAL